MRIISGTYKGKRIKIPLKLKLRPTTDFAKTALFNIIANKYSFTELTVLDVFSGTGSIGIEFISRGAKQVTFVEQHFSHFSFIKLTLQLLSIKNAHVIKADALTYLKNTATPANIIFCDPPYNFEKYYVLPSIIKEKKLLLAGGILIIEHGVDTNFNNQEGFIECRNYGGVYFSFFSFEL